MKKVFIAILLLCILVAPVAEAKKRRHHDTPKMQGTISVLLVFVQAPDSPDGLWNWQNQSNVSNQARAGLVWWQRNLPGSHLSFLVDETSVTVHGDPLTQNVINGKWIDEALEQVGQRSGVVALFVNNWITQRSLPYGKDFCDDYSPGPHAVFITDLAVIPNLEAALFAHGFAHTFGATHRGGGIMDTQDYDLAFNGNWLSDITVEEVGGIR